MSIVVSSGSLSASLRLFSCKVDDVDGGYGGDLVNSLRPLFSFPIKCPCSFVLTDICMCPCRLNNRVQEEIEEASRRTRFLFWKELLVGVTVTPTAPAGLA